MKVGSENVSESLELELHAMREKRLASEKQLKTYLEKQQEYYALHEEVEGLLTENMVKLSGLMDRERRFREQLSEVNRLLVVADEELAAKEKELLNRLKRAQ